MLVKFGNWLFHYRNILFPVFYTALFIPSSRIFQGFAWSILLGSLFIILGVITRCTTIGLVYIIRGGNKRQIHAEALVTGGVYQLCRNPMYLGNILLIIGFGIFANSLIFSVIFAPLFIAFYYAIIKAEENFLLKKFGVVFEKYKNSSNALLPKLSDVKQAFVGHQFNFKRVINKEHNSLFLYISGILLLLWYQHLILWDIFLFLFSLLLLIYLSIKLLKNEKKL
jgi:protein-S-isoprenylcysteine O-methyltransferase Ste14